MDAELLVSPAGEPVNEAVLEMLREAIEAEEFRGAASRKESAIHAAADSFIPRLSVAFRHAFAMGRKALRARRSPDAAAEAVEKALKATLYKALLVIVEAGGRVAAGELGRMRTLGGPGSGNFGHAGRPGEVGGSASNGESPLAGERPGVHTPTGQKRLIAFLEKETGSEFKAHGSTARGEESQNDFDIVMVPPTAEEDARNMDLAHEFESQLHDQRARGEITEQQMMEMLYGEPPPPPFVTALKKIGFEYESDVAFDGTPTGRSGNPEVSVVRFKNKKTDHTIEVWIPLGDTSYRGASLRTLKPRPSIKLAFKFDAASEDAVDWAKRHAAKLISDVSDTTRKRVRNAIVKLIDEDGGDWDKALAAIERAVGDEDRAELIARNEVMKAANEGQRQAWDQAVEEGLLPPDVRRTWITVGDGKVCPICEELDGAVADLDGEYPGEGGEGPPAHVECRCTEGIVG